MNTSELGYLLDYVETYCNEDTLLQSLGRKALRPGPMPFVAKVELACCLMKGLF